MPIALALEPDQRHVAVQDIQELRKLVDIGSADDEADADAGNARIALGRLGHPVVSPRPVRMERDLWTRILQLSLPQQTSVRSAGPGQPSRIRRAATNYPRREP